MGTPCFLKFIDVYSHWTLNDKLMDDVGPTDILIGYPEELVVFE